MGGGGEMLVCSSVGLTRIRGSAAATLQGPHLGEVRGAANHSTPSACTCILPAKSHVCGMQITPVALMSGSESE